jgi:hypothetical protein
MPKIATEAQIKIHLQTLTETPSRLLACSAGLDETRLKTAPASDAWSVVEHLAHLRGAADVWSFSIYAMLTTDKPQLAYLHPREWAKRQKYTKLSFAENFEAFKIGRDNLLRILTGLSMEEWGRSATITGKVNTFTVFGETLRMASHEADHCQQLQTMRERV